MVYYKHFNCLDSRDWQQYGKDRQMLCYECRTHIKKHGELPPVPVGVNKSAETPYLFRPVQNESPDSSPGRMRTRGKTKEQVGLFFKVFAKVKKYLHYLVAS